MKFSDRQFEDRALTPAERTRMATMARDLSTALKGPITEMISKEAAMIADGAPIPPPSADQQRSNAILIKAMLQLSTAAMAPVFVEPLPHTTHALQARLMKSQRDLVRSLFVGELTPEHAALYGKVSELYTNLCPLVTQRILYEPAQMVTAAPGVRH